jgi:putative glycerol kinase 5
MIIPLDAQVDAENILCLGLSVQRATFVVIDKVTGDPYTQLISWYDRRANEIVRQINASCLMKVINGGASLLYCLTHKNRYKQGSSLRFENSFVCIYFLFARQ